MPDYTSILKRSLSTLPDANGEMREAVYQRARAALARQLTAVEPPLSGREIERQHQDLEDAVARLEAEFAAEAADDKPPEEQSSEDKVYTPSLPAVAPLQTPPPVPARPERLSEEPRSEFDEEDDGDDDDEDDDDEYERSSRVPFLIGLLMLVLVVGGAAAYGYAERGSLMSFLGLSDAEEQVASTDVAAVPAAIPPAEPDAVLAEAAADDKRPDRLANGTEPPPVPAPADEAPVTAEPPPSPEAPTETALLEPEAPVVLPDEAPETAAPLPAESPPGLDADQTAALDPPAETGGSIVAQRAIYYFQGQEGSPGQATEGTVAWAQITRDNAPAVQATLRLAEQNVTTTVTIYKNSDSTLPASHLVEVQFSGTVGASPIQRVPALVLKQTEQARGQPLTGAAVPVTEDLFWIALSDDNEQIVRNLQLLREGSWFDIPILFNDGTRALLTFEKGIPGDRVFETVMSAWTPA